MERTSDQSRAIFERLLADRTIKPSDITRARRSKAPLVTTS